MKRTPLVRKTPMPRGTVQLKRTAMPRQRKPLAYQSRKTAALYRDERTPLNRELEIEPRRCEFPLGCTETASCWHEYLTRGQGGSITDRDNLRASCVPHNVYAEDHPIECHDIGWRYSKKRAAELAVIAGE